MSSNTNTPLVSIMMTSYNRAEYIREAILSVLAQSYQNWELLVLDDGSHDNTEQVVNAFNDARIKWLPAPQNMGITRNRNRGFQHAHGEYIAVLDSDDVWCDASKLGKQVAFMESNPGCVAVGTFAKIINSDGAETGTLTYLTSDAAIRNAALRHNPFVHSSTLIRKSAITEAEPYDITVPIWEDYDLFLRLGQRGTLANIPEILTSYREHGSNISKARKIHGAQTHLLIIKKYRTLYPGYFLALVKAYIRILRALF